MPPVSPPAPGRLPATYDPDAPSSGEAPAPGSVDWTPAAPAEDPLALPQEQPGRYRPPSEEALIGRGGLGVVLAVWDEVLGREVACKVLSTAHPSPAVAARFVREARATAGLQHPGIVPVYDLGLRRDGLPYYTMKRVRGQTLAAAIQALPTLNARLGLLGAFVDVCQAIAYAHSKGVIHRDLKPANIMVGEFGETVVLDWGLALLPGETAEAGAIGGTPAYMAPEQAGADPALLSPAADLWGLGAVLYEILAGHAPFLGDEPRVILAALQAGDPPGLRAVCPEVPPELAAIVARAMARSPGDRYGSAAALASDVEAWRAGMRVGAYAYAPLELLRLFVARHQQPVAVAMLGLLALVLLGAVSYARILSARDRAQSAEAVAVSNLADALAEKAVATPEIEPFTAELYAAGALAMGERPEARGVIARAARRWAPVLEGRITGTSDCGALAWAGKALLCLRGDRLLSWEGNTPRLDVALGADRAINLLAVSPDGASVAVPLDGGVLALVDSRSGAVRFRLAHGADKTVRSAAFSADGSRLLAGVIEGGAGEIVAWDTATGARVGALPDSVYAEAMTAAPDGTIWATTRGLPGRAWSTIQIDPRLLQIVGHRESPNSAWGIDASPDGRWLAAASGDGTLNVWDARTPDAPAQALGEAGHLGLERWAPDGRLLVDLREDGVATFWRPGLWTPLFRMELPLLSWRALAISPDGARLAAMTAGGVALWRLGAVPVPGDLSDGPVPNIFIGFSPRGDWILSADIHSLALWGLDGAPLRRFGIEIGVDGVGISPDGGVAAVVTAEGARLVDLRTGAVRRSFGGGGLRTAALADHGRWLVALGADGALTAWDAASGALAWQRGADGLYDYIFGGDEPAILALARDGAAVLVGGRDGAVRRLSDGKDLYFGGLSGNGRWAVLSGRDGTVTVYDTRTAAEVDRFRPYDGMNPRVAASDDGGLVAAGGTDGALRVWDRTKGRVVAVLRGHRQRLQHLAFSPDGRLLVSTDWGAAARSWDLSQLDTPGSVLLERAERQSNLRLDGVSVVGAKP